MMRARLVGRMVSDRSAASIWDARFKTQKTLLQILRVVATPKPLLGM